MFTRTLSRVAVFALIFVAIAASGAAARDMTSRPGSALDAVALLEQALLGVVK